MKIERKQIRHLEEPKTLKEKLYRLRYTLARRIVQFGLLFLFIGTARCGWTLFGKPILNGDLSTSRILDTIPLSDPFATLQRLCAQWWLSSETLIGAFFVLLIYIFVSGRSFCSWVCPMNFVTDASAWCREKLGLKTEFFHIPNWARYIVMVLSLLVSLVSGVAAFEAVSPQAMIWREIVYGIGLGFISTVFGVFAFDLAVAKRGWCGHVCPLGAFWATVGSIGQIKVQYDASTCSRCGDCLKVCPEPQVLNFNRASERGMVASGECTNCGKCIAICPENSLKFGLRSKVKHKKQNKIS